MNQVVRCFLKNDEWKYLLVIHSKGENWTLPWWHVEKDESIYNALEREIKEEFNLEINIKWNTVWINRKCINELVNPLCVYEIEYSSAKYKLDKKLEFIFLAEIVSWEIIVQEEEIKEYKFYTKEEILKLENVYWQVKSIIKHI